MASKIPGRGLGQILDCFMVILVCLSTITAHPLQRVETGNTKENSLDEPRLQEGIIMNAKKCEIATERQNATEGLDVIISQKSSSPPIINVRVENRNPYPITFLQSRGKPYSSPFSYDMLSTGVLKLIPQGSEASYPFPVVFFYPMRSFDRETASDVLIEVKAHGATDGEVIIGEILKEDQWKEDFDKVDKDVKNAFYKPLGSSATVYISGTWGKIWAEGKEELLDRIFAGREKDEEVPIPRSNLKGTFQSNSLNVTMPQDL